MLTLYDSFITNDKITICFHKSCVDWLFATIIILSCLSKDYSYFSDFILMPLSPNEILQGTARIQELENVKKIILDLPFFGSNNLYYFDHHITNQQTIPKNEKNCLLDISAASTCSVLKRYFKIDQDQELHQLIEIANIIDQAQFRTSPPGSGPIVLTTDDDIIWACNDLVKDIRDETELIKLVETFKKGKLKEWINQHRKHIINYRKRRQKTLDIKDRLTRAPVIIIKNDGPSLQAEGLHFSLSAEEKDYKMLILLEKTSKKVENSRKTYRVSFRLNPKLTNEETESLRVDEIAKELGGGGHKGAASANISNEKDYDRLMKWIVNLTVNYTVNEIN